MPNPNPLTPAPLQRLDYDVATLMARHPPRLRHPHKALLFELACPSERPPQGRVGYTRWAAVPLPQAWSWSEPPTNPGSSGRESAHDPLAGNEGQFTSAATVQEIEARRSSPGTSPLALEARPDFYDYQPAVPPPAVEWHVNYGCPGFTRDGHFGWE